MIKVAEQVVVEFAGDGAGSGELSWGQRDIWRAMVRQQTWLPNGAWGALPAGTGIDDVAEQLSYLMSRFPTARTRLRFEAGGATRQVVAGHGETFLDVIDTGGAEPEQLAEQVRLHLQDSPFDVTTDWPVRMAVIRDGAVLTHAVVVQCHLVTDGLGAQVLLEELNSRPDTPIPALQPLEQARWQQSPAGERQHANALRHWDGILRSMPPRRYPESTGKQSPRHWRGEFRSPALALALQAITDRTGLPSAPALLGIFAVALARVTGVNPVVVRPMVNNRFRPGLDRVVCMLAQYGISRLDVADATFGETLDRAARSALTTYKHAYYDPAGLDERIAAIVAERGDLQLPPYFNDRRAELTPSPAGPDPSLRPKLDAAGPGTFLWTTRQDVPFEPLIVHIDDVPGATQLIVFMDTHVISPADAEALLRGVQSAAVEAALDPAAPTRVTAALSAVC